MRFEPSAICLWSSGCWHNSVKSWDWRDFRRAEFEFCFFFHQVTKWTFAFIQASIHLASPSLFLQGTQKRSGVNSCFQSSFFVSRIPWTIWWNLSSRKMFEMSETKHREINMLKCIYQKNKTQVYHLVLNPH